MAQNDAKSCFNQIRGNILETNGYLFKKNIVPAAQLSQVFTGPEVFLGTRYFVSYDA